MQNNTNEATAANQPEIMPVFLGSPDPTVVKALAASLDQSKYEPVVMGAEVLEASTSNWIYSKLGQVEKDRINQQHHDEKYRQEAIEYSNELKDNWPSAGGFKMYELKKYFNENRSFFTNGKSKNVNFSNKDVENVLDLLLNMGYCTPTVVDVPKHKQVFAITIDQTSRLQYLQTLEAGYEAQVQELLNTKQTVSDEIAAISRELLVGVENLETNAAPEATGDEAKPPKKKRATTPKKKKVSPEATDDSGAHPVAASDAVNDR